MEAFAGQKLLSRCVCTTQLTKRQANIKMSKEFEELDLQK